MSIIRENNRDRSLDKNLQDDWIPDQKRTQDSTSDELPEYGGDLKRKDTLKDNPKNPASQKDPLNWKKQNV